MFFKFTLDKAKNRKNLSSTLTNRLKAAATKSMPLFRDVSNDILPKKIPVTIFNLQDHAKLYFVENKPVLVELGYGQVFPHLRVAIENQGLLRTIFVDEEATRTIMRGADLMAPGAFGVDESFHKDEIVQICLIGQNAPFAICILEMEGEEIMKHPEGVAGTTLHTVKDELWTLKMD